jgi:hypothetical protein
MFIAHFGVGFGAKRVAPEVSLGWLLLAAQFLDLLWPTFLLLGIESVRIVPGATQVTPLIFEHYPVSHSLLAVLAWAVVACTAYWFARRDRAGAIVIGALVISHWLLDAIVHQPDLLIVPGGALAIGLNAWSSLPLTMVIELSLFALGMYLYIRATRPNGARGKWGLWGLVLLLAAIYAANLFGSPPPSVAAIAWAGQLQWLLVLWGFWIDRHRRGQLRA